MRKQISLLLHADSSLSDTAATDTSLLDLAKFILDSFKQNGFDKFIPFSLNSLDPSVLLSAFTHKSAVNEISLLQQDYERLEFLGDAVLDLVMVHILMDKFPTLAEGDLSKLRASLVNEKALAHLSIFFGFDRLTLMGKGEWRSKGYLRSSVLSDVWEACLALIYLQSGIEKTIIFYKNCLKAYEQQQGSLLDIQRLDSFDPKSQVHELCAKAGIPYPEYVSEELASGDFRVSAIVKGKKFGPLAGPSKKNIIKQLAYQILNENLFKGENNAH